MKPIDQIISDSAPPLPPPPDYNPGDGERGIVTQASVDAVLYHDDYQPDDDLLCDSDSAPEPAAQRQPITHMSQVRKHRNGKAFECDLHELACHMLDKNPSLGKALRKIREAKLLAVKFSAPSLCATAIVTQGGFFGFEFQHAAANAPRRIRGGK